MATTTQVPLEVYLLSDFSPDAEYIDGQIHERPMGENDHSALQLAICTWFAAYATQWKIRVRPELRIQVSARNFLVADAAILDASLPKERFATHPPVAVFEVLSPENSMREMMRKLHLYREMGIPHIWLIDPADRVWQRFTEDGLHPAAEFVHKPLNISFSLAEITNRIDD